MRRRDFIAGFASMGAWPSSLYAQSNSRRYRVGMLDTSARHLNPNLGHFERGLRERGYIEGQNLTFEYRTPDGRNESFAELARELVRLNVDVIVTRGTPAALAAKAASATIPVVMAAAGDPQAIIRGGGAPSANLTGFGAFAPGTERKRVEILKTMLVKVERVAALMNLSNPSRRSEWNEIEAGARSIGVEAQVLDARTVADLEHSFDSATRWRADALVVGSDTLVQTNQSLVLRLAASHRLPSIYTFRDFVDAGGLVSYGVSLPDLYGRAAAYVDRILKGARVDELPVEAPTRFEMIINLKTARALGLAVPDTLLSSADEVIQ
jgi:putative tryptophan/tyrosine transport system substrate-binding protein